MLRYATLCYGGRGAHAQRTISNVFKTVSKRIDGLCNFVEDEAFFGRETRVSER